MASTITRNELADLIEEHAQMLAQALRGDARNATAQHRSRSDAPDLDGIAPGSWSKVGELDDQSYTWPGPEGTEHYTPFEVWEAAGPSGIQIGLGDPNKPGIYYGKERDYWLAFEMINGQKRRPIVVFNEADDYDESGDLVAIIKGKGDGGRSMFSPGDDLPAGYERLEIDVFRDRITGPQAYNRLAVIARGGDRQAMCTHAALQLGLRF
jgi:hypothetical protein